jgi:hypothetical protein
MTGKLEHQDYVIFAPKFETVAQKRGKLRLLFLMEDFHGGKPRAALDDFKLDVKHFGEIERIAIVGDKKWEKGMSYVIRAFTTADVRYFDMTLLAEARAWLEGNETRINPVYCDAILDAF